MSQCDHTWVMDDSPRPACHKCFMERDACALADRIATLERELAAAWWAAWGAIWPVVGHGMEVWEADGHWERELAAVTAERDALRAERVMFCALVDSLTAERDALLESSAEFRMLVQRYYDECGIADDCGIGERLIASLAPTPPTGTPGDGTR